MPIFSRTFAPHVLSLQASFPHRSSDLLGSGCFSPRKALKFYALSFFLFLSTGPTLFAMQQSNARAALQNAILSGHFQKMLAIMQTLSEQEIKKHLPQILQSAVHHGEYDMAKLALETGANPNMFINKETGFTILMHAALHSLPSIVELLIKHGADVLARDHYKHNALFFCSGNTDSIYGANIALILEEKMRESAQEHDGGYDIQESLDQTLHETVTKNRQHSACCLIERLISLGANQHQLDKDGASLVDLSLRQLSKLNREGKNAPIKEKVETLYTRGATTNLYVMSTYEDYISREEVEEWEKEKTKRRLEIEQELLHYAPLPAAIANLTAEYLIPPNPSLIPHNPRKRKREDGSDGAARVVALKPASFTP